MDAVSRAHTDAMPAPSASQPDSHRLDLDLRHDRVQRHRGSSASDGRDAAAESLSQHLQARSSPAAASVDSFSSYINKDAPLFQQRSSSPRAEDQLRDLSDPASHSGSPRLHPRHLVSTPVVSRDAFRHRHWADTDVTHTPAGVMSIEHLHTSHPSHHAQQPRDATDARDPHDDHAKHAYLKPTPLHDRNDHAVRSLARAAVPASPSPAIDVNRLSVSNLAQKNQEDDEREPVYRDARRAPASLLDDSFESTASVAGDDAKNEIRRRRRTRPDEANLLAQVYTKNPFPDHETRLFLANRVGMSVRAVSVWFQNRRQAEKKRSGRYGGSGIAPNGGAAAPATGQSTPAVAATPVRAPATVQRKPLGNVVENVASPAKRVDAREIRDLSSNNKENIPPWLAGRDTASLHHHLEQLKRDTPPKPAVETSVVATPRDLRQAVGPHGSGISAHAVQVEPLPQPTLVAGKTALSRHRSVPRLSLDEVLGGRTQTLRRAATERTPLTGAASSEAEEEALDTILPPPRLLSRASSASSLSLMTTSGGRASIGSASTPKPAPIAVDEVGGSLTSSLPPKLTEALQRQGIIGACDEAVKRANQGQGLLRMMPSSSVSSSEADAMRVPPRDEEDEERTLKLIAQRRAAKAQAIALAKAQQTRDHRDDVGEACADARAAIAAQVPAAELSVGKRVVGLAARSVSLDWAAGRDRASTSALSISIGGTPLSRSASARQLPTESTPLRTRTGTSAPSSTTAAVTKRKAAKDSVGPRSLSATDLTRRLHEAKRKGDVAARPANRKRGQANDENAPRTTTATVETVKRRRGLDEMLAPSEAGPRRDMSPMLSRSFVGLPARLPMTPQSVYTTTTAAPIPGAAALSARTDRYRAIGVSPAMSRTAGTRASGGTRGNGETRGSGEMAGTIGTGGMGMVRRGWGYASTPSRVLGDRTNFAPATPAFAHDDSGFFDAMSDDDSHPHKSDPRDDHHAAELLLGLGKSAVDSRGSSASQ